MVRDWCDGDRAARTDKAHKLSVTVTESVRKNAAARFNNDEVFGDRLGLRLRLRLAWQRDGGSAGGCSGRGKGGRVFRAKKPAAGIARRVRLRLFVALRNRR